MADVCQWSLEFSFKDDLRCKKFIKKLLQLPYTIKFTYSEFYGDEGHRYYIAVEGNWAKTLTVVSKLIEKVDYQYE